MSDFVIVALITGACSAIPGTISAIGMAFSHNRIRETNAQVKEVVKTVNGGSEEIRRMADQLGYLRGFAEGLERNRIEPPTKE